jgi:hypothetical protein
MRTMISPNRAALMIDRMWPPWSWRGNAQTRQSEGYTSGQHYSELSFLLTTYTMYVRLAAVRPLVQLGLRCCNPGGTSYHTTAFLGRRLLVAALLRISSRRELLGRRAVCLAPSHRATRIASVQDLAKSSRLRPRSFWYVWNGCRKVAADSCL